MGTIYAKTFDEAREAVVRHRENTWDRKVGSMGISADISGALVMTNGEVVATQPTKYAMERLLSRMTTKSTKSGATRPHITRTSLEHLCTKPSRSRYLQGGIDYELQARIVNNLLHNFHSGKNWLFRCRGNNGATVLRAALSDRFVPFDHGPFLDMLLNPKAGLASVGRVHRMSIGDYAEDLYLKVVFPDLEVNMNGETYRPGLTFFNGELGNRMVGFDPFIYTQSCTNDLIVQGEYSFSQRHSGRLSSKIMTAEFADKTATWMDQCGHHIEDLEELRDVEIPDLGKVMKAIKQKQRLSDENTARLQGHIEAGSLGQTTALDVVNGVTAFARQIDDADERYDMERAGGGLYQSFVKAMKKERVTVHR